MPAFRQGGWAQEPDLQRDEPGRRRDMPDPDPRRLHPRTRGPTGFLGMGPSLTLYGQAADDQDQDSPSGATDARRDRS